MARRLLIFVLVFSCFSGQESGAVTLKAEALLSKTDLLVGESAILKILVSGSKKPETPDLSHVNNFTVEFKSCRQENPRTDRSKEAEETTPLYGVYSFFYEISPKYMGRLVIPAIDIFADGYATRTNFMVVNVHKPEDSENFKLRVKLSKPGCYIGEPVVLTVTWYIGKNVKDYHFNMPLLEDSRFRLADADGDEQSAAKKYRIPIGNLMAIGEAGHGVIDEREYTTITFRKILIPVGTGNVTIAPAAISFRTPFGSQEEKTTVNSEAFPDSITGDLEGYRSVVLHSNPLALSISSLPRVGRPPDFAGHVGSYRIKAAATPVEVSVGDPITVTLSLSGPEYVGHVDPPDVRKQPEFFGNFRLSKNWSAARISGKSKMFTLRIRPLNTSIKEIPPIELPFFDTEKGRYRIARSNPVPLTVKEAKVAIRPEVEMEAAVTESKTTDVTSSGGIASIYEDMSVLEQRSLSPLNYFRTGYWPLVCFCPPIIYILLLSGASLYRKRNSDPKKKISKKALNRMIKKLKKIKGIPDEDKEGLVFNAFRQYLGEKFGMSSGGSITFSEAKQKLESMGTEKELIERLRSLFESCEMGRYGGNIFLEDSASLVNDAIGLAKDLEKRLE